MSARVLIADGDTERAASLASACSAAGLAPRIVHHGAAALESALADVPEAMVCQIALPLIEARRLEQILRANVRTRDIAIVFLAESEAQAQAEGFGGPVVAPPCDADLVLGCVYTALGGGGDTDGDAAGEDAGAVEGQLAQLPLGELLQLLHVGRKTGRVEVTRGLGRSRRQVGTVLLHAGEVVGACVGDVRGRKALYRLLAWDGGSFVFVAGEPPRDSDIAAPTRPLLREGLRQIAEWQRMALELPPLSASVVLRVPRSSLPNVIHPLTQEVLMVLDLCSRVQDVVDQCTYPDYQVLRTLHTLIERGMVELQPDVETPDLAQDARIFTPARTARLREWLDLDRPGSVARRDAKLVVVADTSETVRGFVRMLERLPDLELAPDLDRDAIEAHDLVSLGRLAVDRDVGVELVHVPAAEGFAPVWPLARHGALATLLLLTAPIDERLAQLAAAAEALGVGHPGRVYHLMLLDKSERVSIDEVRQHLSLVDEGSLVVLPLENTEKVGVLLRELFGRILP